MREPRRCSACGPTSVLGETVTLASVNPELECIERMSREIDDLTAVLRSRLPLEHFRLVWSLRDSVERLGLAEELLRERCLVDSLAHHLPQCSEEINSIRQHVRAAGAAVDGPA